MVLCTVVVLFRIFCLLGSIKVIYSGSDNFHFNIGWEKPMPQGYILPENSNPKLKRIASAYEDSAEKLAKAPIPIFEPNPPMKKVQFGFGIDGLLSWVKKSNSSGGKGGGSWGGDDCDEEEELDRIIIWKLIARQMGDDLMAEKINDMLKDALKNGLCPDVPDTSSRVREEGWLKAAPDESEVGRGPPPKFPEKERASANADNWIDRAGAMTTRPPVTKTTTQAPLNDQPVGNYLYKQRTSGKNAASRKNRTNGKRLRKKQSKKKQEKEMMKILMNSIWSKNPRKNKVDRSLKKRKNRPRAISQKQSTGQVING